MKAMKRKLVEGTDWIVEHDGMLVCPCGHRVEDDGTCPNGHTSPMRERGLI